MWMKKINAHGWKLKKIVELLKNSLKIAEFSNTIFLSAKPYFFF